MLTRDIFGPITGRGLDENPLYNSGRVLIRISQVNDLAGHLIETFRLILLLREDS